MSWTFGQHYARAEQIVRQTGGTRAEASRQAYREEAAESRGAKKK